MPFLHICHHCGKHLSRKQNLDNHIARYHGGKCLESCQVGDDLAKIGPEKNWSGDIRFQHPYTAVLAGPTGSGKTQFIRNFLKNLKNLVVPVPTMILFCYAEWQPAYEEMKTFGLNIHFIKGVGDLDSLTQGPPKLVIVDDLMAEANEQITRLFTKGSHHKNISVMHIVQNLFSKNKEERCINLDSHYMRQLTNRPSGQTDVP